MSESATHQVPTAPEPPSYLERLRTPAWWYLAALAVAVVLGAEFGFAVHGWVAWVPFVLLVPVSLLVVLRLSSGTIKVGPDGVSAGDRTLALDAIAETIELSPSELRRVVGRYGDPLAFNFIRSWVGPGVQLVLVPPAHVDEVEYDITLDDDADYERYLAQRKAALHEPYWLISSRHPRELANSIRAAAAQHD